jgi:mono/diheme cytochrome c family protein
MKKFGKWVAYVVISLILLVVIIVSYVVLALPNVGKPENITVAVTPERVARGKYLANNVSSCTDCHSTRDWTNFAAPLMPGTIGGGGEKFDASVGFPGKVEVPNITPYNLKDWTDGEIFRAITCGVEKDGKAIFPLMPWPYYSKMDREDVYSIIAYLRTLTPIRSTHPPSELDFPLNVLVHTMPAKATLGTKPDEHDTLKYGAYLVQIAACKECHSKDDHGTPVAGMEFAGDRVFGLPGGAKIHTANITPDKTTGIGLWTKEQFVKRFTQYADSTIKPTKVAEGGYQTIMPWWNLSKMKKSDLEAIYTYLRTLKPVSNKFERFERKSAVAAN